jgi:hypothetical protein
MEEGCALPVRSGLLQRGQRLGEGSGGEERAGQSSASVDRGRLPALWLVRRTERVAGGTLPGAVAGDPASRAQPVQLGRDARARAAAAHAHARAVRRLRGEPGMRVQHLPGERAAQPLLGAVRVGRAHGVGTAVPNACGRVAKDKIVASHARLAPIEQ